MSDKLLINCQHGSDDLEKATVAMIVAGATAAMDGETAMFLTCESVRLAAKGGMDGLQQNIDRKLRSLQLLPQNISFDAGRFQCLRTGLQGRQVRQSLPEPMLVFGPKVFQFLNLSRGKIGLLRTSGKVKPRENRCKDRPHAQAPRLPEEPEDERGHKRYGGENQKDGIPLHHRLSATD